MARMLPREAENGVGMNSGLPGEESVKRFERSNGLDIALYKTIHFILTAFILALFASVHFSLFSSLLFIWNALNVALFNATAFCVSSFHHQFSFSVSVPFRDVPQTLILLFHFALQILMELVFFRAASIHPGAHIPILGSTWYFPL